jgi:hypothetical protein
MGRMANLSLEYGGMAGAIRVGEFDGTTYTGRAARAICQLNTAGALLSSVTGLRHCFEGFGLKLAIALQKDLYFAFGFFQFLAAGTGELHAFIKEFQSVVERNISLF